MTYSPNIPFELLRALLTIAGWYVLFYQRRRPESKLRRVLLLASFPACYTMWRVMVIANSTINQINWVAIILLFALLCGDLWGSSGSMFTGIYYISIEACMDTLRAFIVRYSSGRMSPLFSPAYYMQINLLYLVLLGWTLFYYRVLKNRQGKLPLHFWIMIVIPPLGSTALLTYFADVARPLLDNRGINIYLMGILMGLFLIALNLFTFYMYVRQLDLFESRLQTQILQGQMDAFTRRVTVIEAFQRQAEETRHEYKNTLFGLKAGMEQQQYTEVNNRLASLLGDYTRAEPECYTGIPLIDAVISYKAVRLRELGAALSIQADLLDADAAGTLAYDIGAIMGIALDNVTDACEILHRADQTAVPPVSCAIQKKPLLLLIRVTNPLPRPLAYKNGGIQSTKAQSGHGLGLSALRRIAGKYGGKVTVADTDGTFSLTVTLFM
ncbi:hypothetical protein FACS189450_05150 [Spirochaetia bacterium]|nr:hypothetical protein FACS189450_05150 [Spirochaetia bacterium]